MRPYIPPQKRIIPVGMLSLPLLKRGNPCHEAFHPAKKRIIPDVRLSTLPQKEDNPVLRLSLPLLKTGCHLIFVLK
jgi:hypothetical protein